MHHTCHGQGGTSAVTWICPYQYLLPIHSNKLLWVSNEEGGATTVLHMYINAILAETRYNTR